MTNDAVDRGRHRIEGRWRTVWGQTEIDGGQMEERWKTDGGQMDRYSADVDGWSKDYKEVEDR